MEFFRLPSRIKVKRQTPELKHIPLIIKKRFCELAKKDGLVRTKNDNNLEQLKQEEFEPVCKFVADINVDNSMEVPGFQIAVGGKTYILYVPQKDMQARDNLEKLAPESKKYSMSRFFTELKNDLEKILSPEEALKTRQKVVAELLKYKDLRNENFNLYLNEQEVLKANWEIAESIVRLYLPEVVKLRLAEDVNTSKKVLEALAKYSSWEVKIKVAQNKNAPIAALESLAAEEHPYIIILVIRNPNTPRKILGALAKHPDWKIREEVADNESTPVKTLKFLAKDKNVDVIKSLIYNSSTPLKTLATLLLHSNSKVSSLARRKLGSRLKRVIKQRVSKLFSRYNFR